MSEPTVLRVHLALDDESGRWFIPQSDIAGLNLDAATPDRLIAKIAEAVPDLLELNAVEFERSHGIKPGGSVRVVPIFDDGMPMAA